MHLDGDYGETNWRGINQAALDSNDFIKSSAARMNDYYLKTDANGVMQYTMCHELGHAFGVPHSDEDFENDDLGNCMDYSRNFEVSKHPDESNYNYLVDLYGLVPSRRRYLRRGVGNDERPPSLMIDEDSADDVAMQQRTEPIPEHIAEKMQEHVRRLEQGLEDHEARAHGWKLLHRSEHGEEHEMALEDGYKVRVHLLLA